MTLAIEKRTSPARPGFSPGCLFLSYIFSMKLGTPDTVFPWSDRTALPLRAEWYIPRGKLAISCFARDAANSSNAWGEGRGGEVERKQEGDWLRKPEPPNWCGTTAIIRECYGEISGNSIFSWQLEGHGFHNSWAEFHVHLPLKMSPQETFNKWCQMFKLRRKNKQSELSYMLINAPFVWSLGLGHQYGMTGAEVTFTLANAAPRRNPTYSHWRLLAT